MDTTVLLRALLTAKPGLVIYLIGRALEKPPSETPLLAASAPLPAPTGGPSSSSFLLPKPWPHLSPLVFILPHDRMEFLYLKMFFIFKSSPKHWSTMRANRSFIV